jgi:hypothetical protein
MRIEITFIKISCQGVNKSKHITLASGGQSIVSQLLMKYAYTEESRRNKELPLNL